VYGWNAQVSVMAVDVAEISSATSQVHSAFARMAPAQGKNLVVPCYQTSHDTFIRAASMSWKRGDAILGVPAKRYRIGELVRYSPFSRQTIHNYTIMGLIREAEWTEGGHRLYDESVFDRLARIIELRKTKSLIEIGRILRQEETASVTPAHGRDESAGNQQIAGDSHRMDADDDRPVRKESGC
jgi:DNA-binding transcriptional MerR regulator